MDGVWVGRGTSIAKTVLRRVLVDGSSDAGGELLQFVGGHLHVVCKVEVAGLVEGHEVDVGVRDVDADDGFADLDAGADLLKASGDALGEEVELAEEVVVEVEDVVDLLLGDAEDVSADDGVDVEERKAMFRFGDFIARYFAGDNFREDAGHG